MREKVFAERATLRHHRIFCFLSSKYIETVDDGGKTNETLRPLKLRADEHTHMHTEGGVIELMCVCVENEH